MNPGLHMAYTWQCVREGDMGVTYNQTGTPPPLEKTWTGPYRSILDAQVGPSERWGGGQGLQMVTVPQPQALVQLGC